MVNGNINSIFRNVMSLKIFIFQDFFLTLFLLHISVFIWLNYTFRTNTLQNDYLTQCLTCKSMSKNSKYYNN